MADKVLDAKGLNCPLPILKAKKALKEVPDGGTLEILATDPGAVADFQAAQDGAQRNQALGDGMIDVAMIRLVERNKPEARRTPEIVAANERKTREAVARLEKDVAMLTDRPYDIGHIAIGTALGYLDFDPSRPD